MTKAFSLFELLIYILITTVLYLCVIPTLQRLMYIQTAKQTLQQIESTINYARSIAILQQRKIHLCPSKDRKTCDKDWRVGLLLVDSGGEIKQFLHTDTAFNGSLQLRQSGHTNYRLTIDANGMTSSNGHFNARPSIASGWPEFNLYFNKGLRLYTTRTD